MAEVDDKESVARAQLPYRAEYCKSNRAKCKKCQETMAAGSLKLANMVKSRFHDGFDANYYHVECFFRIKRPTSVADIRHFETLKYEDQKLLEKAVESNGHSVLMGKGGEVDADVKRKGKSKLKRSADDQAVNYEDFLVEYAKSSRAKCGLCEENIMKETVRIGKLDYAADTPYNGGPIPRWHHVECFVKSQEQLDFFGKIEKVKGFKDLEKDDQKMLKKEVKQIEPPKVEEVETKKIKSENGDQDKEERLLKKQSDRFFALREHVDRMKYADVEELLRFMRQKSNYKATTILVDMATDVLLFGPLRKCPVCTKRGGMMLRGSSYICTNELEDGGPCTYETREPGRDAPDFPDEIVEKYPYFQDDYEFRPGKRIFPSKYLKAVEQKEAEDNNVALDGAPLMGLSIGVISYSALKNDKVLVQKKATTLGAKVTTSLEKSLFVILTNKLELEKDSPKMEVAKALEVPFATDEFLFNIKTKDDVVKQLKRCLIGEWDGDIKERFEKMSQTVKTESQ